MRDTTPTRCNFVGTSASVCASSFADIAHGSAAQADVSGSTAEPGKSDPAIRLLGKTGLRVSMLAVGGWHIGRMKDVKNAHRMLHMAADSGVNFFDTAWAYQDGGSEARLGTAFKGRRQRVHLMTKVIARDSETAEKHLQESLRRLQTDYLDLWQFHGITREDEVAQIFGPKGAAECALRAKRDGRIRHIGLTGHRSGPVLRAIREYHDIIETIQVPINVLDPHQESFLAEVVPEAVKENIGVIAMKTCAIGLIIEAKLATPTECLRFVWGRPVAVIVSGMDHYDMFNQNLDLAGNFRPLAADEERKLMARTKANPNPKLEWYKFEGEQMRTYPAEPML